MMARESSRGVIGRLGLLLASLVVVGTLTGCAGKRVRAPIDPVFFAAAVAADQPLASEAGAEILRAGGNAVDAAVATSFALSVVRPYSCGIGGGGFMVVHLTEESAAPGSYALNYREMSPRLVTPDHFEKLAAAGMDRAARDGGHAVAVPGTVAGLLHALEEWGTMERAAVMAPAIRLAEEGFLVDEHYAASARGVIRLFRERPEYQRRFAFTWERLLGSGEIAVGDRIVLPEQAAALRLIAERGAEAFYEGPIAEAIARAVARDGGVLGAGDLAGYRVQELTPIRFEFAGREVLAMPPPSSGGVAMIEILGLLERTGALTPGVDPLGDPLRAHQLVEAMKHAFADRAAHLADPAFAAVPIERLTSDAYLDGLARRFDADRTLEPLDYGSAATASLPDDSGTSHLSVVDAQGNAVAATETINTAFGSLLPVPEFGFCLNNEMDDFTTSRAPNAYGLLQSDRNRPEPGKRPLSSMSPTIVLEGGEVVAVVGGSGGPRIITGTTQVLLRLTAADQPARDAVAGPRLHHQWSPDVVRMEPGDWSSAWAGERAVLEAGLRARGHEVGEIDAVGVVQAIKRRAHDGLLEAASDPRKGGAPVLVTEREIRGSRR